MVLGIPIEPYWFAGGSGGLCAEWFSGGGLGSAPQFGSLNYPLHALVQCSSGH